MFIFYQTSKLKFYFSWHEIDELVQERRNSIASALELRLSCTNPSKYEFNFVFCSFYLRFVTLSKDETKILFSRSVAIGFALGHQSDLPASMTRLNVLL